MTPEEKIKLYEQALRDSGWKAASIEKLTSGTEEEPVDIKEVISTYKAEQEALFKANNPGISEEDKTKDVEAAYRKAKAEFNKIVKVGSRKEVDAMSLDDFAKEFKKFYTTSIEENKNATDEELTNKYNALLTANTELKEKFETLEERYDTDIQNEKARASSEIRTYKTDIALMEKFGSIEWANDHLKEDLMESGIRKVKEKYHINEDGTILDKDGKNAAKSWDETTTYTTIDEAIADLVSRKKWDKKSFAGQKPATIDINGNPAVATEGLSENAKAMLERAQGKSVDAPGVSSALFDN